MTIMANGVFRQDRFSKHEKAHKALRIFLHFLIDLNKKLNLCLVIPI